MLIKSQTSSVRGRTVAAPVPGTQRWWYAVTQTVLSSDKEAVWRTKELYWEHWCRHDTDATGPTPICRVNNTHERQKEASKWLGARCLAHVRLCATVDGAAPTALGGEPDGRCPRRVWKMLQLQNLNLC